MANALTHISVAQLQRAIEIRERIENLENELNELLGAAPVTASGSPARRGRRKVSAAGRARMAAAQRARWAARKGEARNEKPPRRVKRKMSRAGRARLVASLKARWAKARKAGRSRLG